MVATLRLGEAAGETEQDHLLLTRVEFGHRLLGLGAEVAAFVAGVAGAEQLDELVPVAGNAAWAPARR